MLIYAIISIGDMRVIAIPRMVNAAPRCILYLTLCDIVRVKAKKKADATPKITPISLFYPSSVSESSR